MAAPTLTAMGFEMPRKYSTCAPSSPAVRMPIHGMCVEVVPAVLPRNEARLRLLVVKVQPLVARVEVDQRGLVDPPAADAFEEIQRIADRAHDPLVGVLEGRVVHEAQVPVLRMVQVGEAALDQRPYEVQRQRRALIPSQQQLGIRRARLGRWSRAASPTCTIRSTGTW